LPTSYNVSPTQNTKVLSVWIKDSAGNVSARVDSNSVVLDTTPPSPPQILGIASVDGIDAIPDHLLMSGDFPKLYWQASDDVAHYKIRLKTDPLGNLICSTNLIPSTNNTSILDTSTCSGLSPLIQGASYQIELEAYDLAGNQSMSPFIFTKGWKEIPSGSQPLTHHSAVVDPDTGNIYTFGGLINGSQTNSIYQLDQSSTTLFNLSSIQPRQYGSFVFDNNFLYIWGGVNNTTNYADGFELDLLNLSSLPNPFLTSPPSPSPRHHHATVYHPGTQKMLVWGGQGVNAAPLSDGSLFDTYELKWSTSFTNPSLTGRKEMVYGLIGDKAIIWGGKNQSNSPLGDGALYDFIEGTWSLINSPSAPPPLHSRAYATSGNKLYMWGGCSSSTCNTPSNSLNIYTDDVGWAHYSSSLEGRSNAKMVVVPDRLGNDRFLFIYGGQSTTNTPAIIIDLTTHQAQAFPAAKNGFFDDTMAGRIDFTLSFDGENIVVIGGRKKDGTSLNSLGIFKLRILPKP
jgi:hypothetical protein